jgi:hypothetical protein
VKNNEKDKAKAAKKDKKPKNTKKDTNPKVNSKSNFNIGLSINQFFSPRILKFFPLSLTIMVNNFDYWYLRLSNKRY